MRLDLPHLEALVLVDELGGLHAAARRMRLTRTQLERRIDAVEGHLGFPVFRRDGEAVLLTARGRDALRSARRVLHLAECATNEEEVRATYDTVPLPALLAAAAEPGRIALRLRHRPTAAALDDVASGEVGLHGGLWLPQHQWPTTPFVAVTHLRDDPLAVVLPPHHPLAEQPEVRLADLAVEHWVLLGDGCADAVRSDCRTVGGFDPDVRYVVDDSAHVEALVRSGLAVTIAPAATSTPGAGLHRLRYPGATTARWSVAHAAEPSPSVALAVREIAAAAQQPA